MRGRHEPARRCTLSKVLQYPWIRMAANQTPIGPDERRYRMQEVLWEPDLDAYGPRRARTPVRIQAYVPAPLDPQRWRFSSEATAAFGDAQSEISLAQTHADRIGLNTIAQQLLRAE